MRRPQFSSVGILLFGSTAIGMAPIFTRLMVERGGVGSVGAGFWRMFVGALGFLILGLRSPAGRMQFLSSVAHVFRAAPMAVSAAGLMFALDLTAWHISFEYTSVANSTLIANLSSLLVPAAGILFFKEQLKPSMIAGGLVAICGVICLVVYGKVPTQLIREGEGFGLFGDALALLTAFFYTGYMVATKFLTGRFSTTALMCAVCGVSAVGLLISSSMLQSNLWPQSLEGWLWIAMLGFVSQILGQGLIAKALIEIPVSMSALLLLAAPVSSAVFGFLFLHQSMTWGQIGGVALTLVGIAIVARNRQRAYS